MRRHFLSSLVMSAGISLSLVSPPSFSCPGGEAMLGSICMVGFNFCPRGYAEANGQQLDISQNQALFSLLGTIYGGDGRTTFALPDLRGRVPINGGQGPGLSNYVQGSKGGVEAVTLAVSQMPIHNHSAVLQAMTTGGMTEVPTDNMLSNSRRSAIYDSPQKGLTKMNSNSIAVNNTGGNIAHENRQPYLAMKYCIALTGVYPSRN